jgi:adenylosuccinate lyase
VSGVLAERYASDQMRDIWSRTYKIKAERELWILVLKAQAKAGVEISDSVIADYVKAKNVIDIASIDKREMVTKHDVKARIDEFNSLAGHQKIHIGMTSRDLTENIELYQIRSSLALVEMKSLALLRHLNEFISKYSELALVARTHNVPAQLTTLGRRFATWGEELTFALTRLKQLSSRLPLKGIKGPIGTSQDLQDLFGDLYLEIEQGIAKELGFENLLEVPSQIYPRSIDFEVVSSLLQIAAAPSNIAINIRIMSGYGLLSEGFGRDQVGSSAMPHKVNARLSERVNGLTAILKGHLVMVQELLGNQWNEGDVSCSVVRRVALPDAFYAIDAILDTTMRILADLAVDTDSVDDEVKKYLPFLLTTKILALAVKKGLGREDAHSLIKALSITASQNLKSKQENNLLALVAEDKRLGMSLIELESLAKPEELITGAIRQTHTFLKNSQKLVNSNPDAIAYRPKESI